MKSSIFRKDSVDRLNSPEQLNQYIKAARPSVWFILGGIIILLIGTLIWSIFGRIETKVQTGAVVEKGSVICYLKDEDVQKLEPGQTKVRIDATVLNDEQAQSAQPGATAAEGGSDKMVEGTVVSVDPAPVHMGSDISNFIYYLGGFKQGEFARRVNIKAEGLEPGIHKADVVIDSIEPISFVIK